MKKSHAFVALFVAIMLSATQATAEEAVRPPTKHRSVPVMVTGIVISLLGAGSMIAGGVVYADGVASENECERNSRAGGFVVAPCSVAGIGKGFAIPMLAGGGALLLAGAPMAIAGGWRVPDGPRVGTRVPEVRVGPGSATVRWSF